MNNETFQKVWSTSQKEITYQPAITDWEVSTDQIRQFNCSLVYKQRKGNKSAQSPLYNLGSLH